MNSRPMDSRNGHAPHHGNGEIKLPFRDLGAECALLDAMMRDSSIVPEVIPLVQPDQFYQHAHGVIFSTIAKMHASGAPIDIVTVATRIQVDNLADEIGGLPYMVELHNTVTSVGNHREYAAAIRNASVRRNVERELGTPDGATIVGVIAGYLRSKYTPVFRRGQNLWSTILAREVTRSEACAAPTSDLIPALLAATDYPRDQTGNPKRSSLPGIFRQWSQIAWQDLLTYLPDESESSEIADSAGEQFRGSIVELMSMIESFSYARARDKNERTEVQRRSLIDWCRLFAKEGPWRSIRSLALWCRVSPEGHPEVAMHQRLFAQVRRGNLAPPTQRRLVQLCEMYGVGVGGHTMPLSVCRAGTGLHRVASYRAV